MSWFKKLLPSKIRTDSSLKKNIPEGLWTKCEACKSILYHADLESNLYVCPKCRHHMYINARPRLIKFLDTDTFREIGTEIQAVDKLKFRDTKKYKDRIAGAIKQSGEREALVVARGKLLGLEIVTSVFEYKFIGGSMGAAVGERFVQGVNAAINEQCSLICFSATGGARMQEGLISLFQMAKTSAALKKLNDKGLPFISMGGVSASLAMLGDIVIAEPKALIGFAGPRVIVQTVRETLPEGFQRSEFLLEHGAIDMIVERNNMRVQIAMLLSKLTNKPIVNNSTEF